MSLSNSMTVIEACAKATARALTWRIIMLLYQHSLPSAFAKAIGMLALRNDRSDRGPSHS
jgi:hypothetical protein